MRPQSVNQPAPEAAKERSAERRLSGRAQRRAAQEQAERRKQLALVGSAIGVALLVALILILLNRPPDIGAPIVAAEPLPASIPVEGRTMGDPNAPVTLTEWGDFT
jgi:hypothetical protein